MALQIREPQKLDYKAMIESETTRLHYFWTVKQLGKTIKVEFVNQECARYNVNLTHEEKMYIVNQINTRQRKENKEDKIKKQLGMNIDNVISFVSKNTQRDVTKKEERDLWFYIDILHGNHSKESYRQFTTVSQVDRYNEFSQDGWHEWHYKTLKELYDASLVAISNNTAAFTSANEFFRPNKNLLSLSVLNAFYVDIDAHEDVEFDEKAVNKVLKKLYKKEILPAHSFYINTGRGMHLYWVLQDPMPSTLALQWQVIQSEFIELLKDEIATVEGHKVDENVKDASRVLRLPGAYNLVTKTYARLVKSKEVKKYRVGDFFKTYFRHKSFRYMYEHKTLDNMSDKEIKANKQYTAQEKAAYLEAKSIVLRQRRINDLRLLLERRKNQFSDGQRRFFLAVYGWTVIEWNMCESGFISELLSVNRMFKDPRSDDKVRKQAKAIYKSFNDKRLKHDTKKINPNTGGVALSYHVNRYCYKNTTIIKQLSIEPHEREGFETILTEAEAELVYAKRRNEYKRAQRRDEDGNLIKKLPIQERRAEIKVLMEQGYKQKQIAEMLNLDVEVVKNDRKAIKKALK